MTERGLSVMFLEEVLGDDLIDGPFSDFRKTLVSTSASVDQKT